MAKFAGFEPYQLKGIEVTETKIGEGSYATVHELKYMGLKCAGKKIHGELLKQGDTSYSILRFEEECQLLSQIRHPNIVQFLGVHFHGGAQIPTLVMEFLPTNLTSCIEMYGTFPHEIGYSILHDVVLGMYYLHNQVPAIIHRDLSSNNVLLASNMTAKISDLGMAKILNLTPLQVSHMTQTPGTPHFMPPEVMVPNPTYNASVDIFSYGILMIHMFSCQWPEPQVGPNRIDAGKLIPVTEAERREVFLRAIGNDHPLMDLILKCIHNDPQVRTHASEIVERLAEMVLQFPASFVNRLEMLSHIQNIDDTRRSPKVKIDSVSYPTETVQSMAQFKPDSGQGLGTEQLEILLKDLDTQKQVLEAEKNTIEAERSAAKSEVASLSKQIEKLKDTLSDTICKFEENCSQEQESYRKTVSEEYKQKVAEEKQLYEEALQTERGKYKQLVKDHEKALASEREKNETKSRLCDELQANNSMLQVEAIASTAKIESLHSTITTLEEKLAATSSAIVMKDSEINVKTRALQEKDATILAMSEQLTKARRHLSTKPHVLQANIAWKKYADLPIAMYNGRTEIINGKVYFRGMTLTDDDDDDDNILLCYDVAHDSWTALPPLPVKWFGLGQVDGRLVAVGGLKKDDRATSNVYTLNIVQKWKPTLPQMPTARCLPAVVSLQAVMIVAGGLTGGELGKEREMNAVEIFNSSLSQWYRTNPLPRPCSELSLVDVNNTCYALGGYQYPFRLNQALYASVDDLLRNAVPANQTTQSNAPSLWKSLPNTPTYRPAAAVLAGSLLAIGGGEASISEADKKEVYMYSPSTNSWTYISDLPAPRSRTIVAMLSSTEILVIGGMEYGERVCTVYKGTLGVNN